MIPWRAVPSTLVILALPLAAACSKTERAPAGAANEARAPAVVDATLPQERAIPRGVDVTGTLVADAQADVAAEATGRVVAITVERGSHVRPGDVIARLDDADAQHQLREAQAAEAQATMKVSLSPNGVFDPERDPEVAKVRLTMEQMKTDDERYARLVKEGAVPASEAESRHIQYLTAQEEYRAALKRAGEAYQGLIAQRARLATARKALGDTAIQAPFEGAVAEKHVNVGHYVQRGSKVVTLVRVDPLRIELMVPEVATIAVKRAEKVSFSVQAYPDRRFDGRVAYVGPSLRTDSRALVVEAIVPNPERLLHPGFFATARIELPATERALVVPAAAVQTDASVARLFVIKDGRAELRYVQTGRQINGDVEILRGLAAGERVITSGLDQVGDGVPVTSRTR